MPLAPTDAVDPDSCRRGFQAVFGSWAGTLICQGRDDEEIAAVLETSAAGLEGTGVEAIANRARANIIRRLPQLREVCGPVKGK